MKKVIVDILGGDSAPNAMLDGALLALKENNDLELVLVGDKDFIEPRIKGFENRVEIMHTIENISCHEQPTIAIRKQPNSSIVLGQTALRTREDCGAFVSAGSTGAVLTGAFMKVGRIDGVSRPALCPFLPTKKGTPVMVIDTGANMDCKPVNLVHFALMADVYMRAQGVEKPRIGLISVGAEDEKGNELTLETFKLLKQCPIDFKGNVESRDVFSGDYDVVVCDGFAGNVLLKTAEGALSLVSGKLKQIMRGPFGFIGKLCLARKLVKMKRELSEETVGGAVFLGMKKPVIKAHGNSSPKAFRNAILVGARAAQMELEDQIKSAVGKFNEKHG